MVTAVETAPERELAGLIMRGGDKPAIRKLKAEEAARNVCAAGSHQMARLLRTS